MKDLDKREEGNPYLKQVDKWKKEKISFRFLGMGCLFWVLLIILAFGILYFYKNS